MATILIKEKDLKRLRADLAAARKEVERLTAETLSFHAQATEYYEETEQLKAERAELRKGVAELLEFSTEFKPFGFTLENPDYANGDELLSFFTERFLYPLVGKEDARTILSRVREIRTGR